MNRRLIPVPRPRRVVRVLAAITLLTLPALARAQAAATLSLQQSSVSVTWGSNSAPLNLLTDPRHAEGTGTDLYALSDLNTGTLRARAAVPPGGDDARSASTSFEILLRNTSTLDISLGAGALRASLDASFMQSLGVDSRGSAVNSYVASLSGFGAGVNGAASASYYFENAVRPGWPVAYDAFGGSPGFASTGSAGPGGLMATLSLPGFTLQPGDFMRVRLDVRAYAAVVNPGAAPGWSADTDASNSAYLSLRLPAGVAFESPLPLAWVSSVPEPAPLVLWATGMLALAWLWRGCRRPSSAAAASRPQP